MKQPIQERSENEAAPSILLIFMLDLPNLRVHAARGRVHHGNRTP